MQDGAGPWYVNKLCRKPNRANVNDLRDLQKSFHQDADERRYLNRLKNPFIERKEKVLADTIAREMSGGGVEVLEVGCGEGSNYAYLSRRVPGLRYHGLDISANKIAFLKETHKEVNAVCGDASNLPFPSANFDMVICRDILHHLDHAREDLMSEAMRVLKPHGRVLLLESNGNTILNRIFRILYPVERGMKNSTPEKIMSLCSSHGVTRVIPLEPSFLIRAVAFVIGWPEGMLRYVYYPLYAVAVIWERIWEFFAPKSAWTYSMYSMKQKV
jgi:ubiquinone/menaquinone biosynthesis C-methylase UbiE